MQGIYKIEAPSGNFYIGSSTNVRRRFNAHKRDLKSGKHVNSALLNVAAKYGVDALSFEMIASVPNRQDLRDVEQLIINDWNPEYNISKNADCALFDAGVIKKRSKAISKRVVCLTDGMVFESGYAAARHYGEKTPDNISTAIKKGWKFAGHFWKFEGDEITLEEVEKNWLERDAARKKKAADKCSLVKGRPVRRLSDGKIFPSAPAAIKEVGGHRTMIYDAINLKVEKAGSMWEYV